ncbi:HNH endonuclease [Pseudomonas maumuensis]|uniref:HNH endonuclease n=1 Tax=Pseudomonas maumuensis TaxID=2842354 RepID=A0ABX8NSW2_9PSED|nr:HNH endonuclease [Pseudomonas maumuensis]QXH58888.1 HNH endonuclease [Pseudomonas maumuensis]
MKNFQALQRPGYEYFRQIVDSKNNTVKGQPNTKKETLVRLQDQVRLKYLHYQGCFDRQALHSIDSSSFVGVEKESLLWAYSSGGSVLDGLKAEIKNSQSQDWQNLCPYCGISGVDETDHYLPKDDYAEYAVFSLNLIPSCGRCNKKKGNYWKVDGERKILNFYLDQLPDRQFLHCRFSYDNNLPGVEYRLEQDGAISDGLFSVISAHYERLELLGRYKENSNDFITTTIDSILSYSKDLTTQRLKISMLEQYGRMVERYGVNHWQCVLLKEMAGAELFVEHMVRCIKGHTLQDELGL